MRPTKTSPENLPLDELLDDIHRGRIALPDFQRDFDWTERDVQSLLVTVLTGWPIGSLLLVSGKPEYLELRGIEGGPPLTPHDDLAYVVLDGQQRLTSLYQALYARGAHVYAIAMDELGAGTVDELEESVRYFKRSAWESRYGTAEQQWAAQLLPLAALRTASDFYQWRDEVLSSLDVEQVEPTRIMLNEKYRAVLSGLHRYRIPAVTIPHRVPPQAVARVFERVNRTGLALDAFDLAVARSFTASWNLRRRYEAARAKYAEIDYYLGADGLPILQSIALRESENIRESAVIDLPGRLIRERWDIAVKGMVSALRFVREHGGVAAWEFLPYRNLIVLLAAIAQDESSFLGMKNELIAWYWGTVFTESYDVASNTRVVHDFRSLTGVKKVRLQFQQREVVRDTLRSATKRANGALWRGFVCALIRQPALSLGGSDEPLLPDSTMLEMAPVTATSLLSAGIECEDASPRPHLRVLSFIVGTRADCRIVGHGQLIGALNEGTSPHQPAPKALKSQLMPTVKQFEYVPSDWEELLEIRLKLLERHLTAWSGVSFVDYEAGPDE